MGGESQYQNHQAPPQPPPPTSSRLGIRNTLSGGEIVEVQGGHIVRSTGRKDRHSKVCTAKGPRDRRVRLSAHTAIQFYDVQDRLGYDRPSKAVDWLIKKAKAAIDELAELPPWNPQTATTANAAKSGAKQAQSASNDGEYQFHMNDGGSATVMDSITSATAASGRRASTVVGSDVQDLQQRQIGENPNNNSSFLPPSLDSDTIADTIKSFFPMGATAETPSSTAIQFQSYPPDLLSRTSSHSQDLRLSLQSFQEPILLHHQSQHHPQTHQNEQVIFGFDGSSSAGWSEHTEQHHHAAEIARFQRMAAWNCGTDTGGSGSGGGAAGGGGFIFNSPPPLQPLFSHNQFFFQRGPLQSSNTPSARAWMDQPLTAVNNHHQIIHQSAIPGIEFASSGGGFSGFRIPARIQGDEEDHDGIHNKPSSASSDSRH